MEGKKKRRDGHGYLSNVKKPRLPHGFSSMVAQVLVVVGCNDGRELFQRVRRILTEENGWFFSDGGRALHETLALSWPKGCGRLLSFSFYPYNELGNSLGLLGVTVEFLLLLPFGRRFGRTHPYRSLILNLFFQSSLLLDISSSPSSIHLCTKVDGCLE